MALLTGSLLTDCLTVTIGIITIGYFYLTWNYNYWKDRNVKYLKPAVSIGNFWDVLVFKKNPSKYFGDIYRISSEKLHGLFIFRKPYLLIRDPELIKHVLVKDFQHFSNRGGNKSEHDIAGTANLFTIQNPYWKFLRTKLTPVYSPAKTKQMYPLMSAIGEQLNKCLNGRNVPEGASDEIRDYCVKYTTDVIVSTAFGVEANSLNDVNSPFRQVGKQLFTFTLRRTYELLSFFFIPTLANLIGFQLFTDFGTKFIREMFWATMKTREETKIYRPDIIDALIKLKNVGSIGGEEDETSSMEGAIKFEGDYLVAQAGIFFAAGFETTASAMAFTLYQVALDQDIQKRLREEITSLIKEKGAKLEYEDVMELKYLDCCVKESLRLYPALPFLNRECTIPYTFPGTNVSIDKDVQILISLDGLQKDPAYFPDPLKYDPDRWSDENKENIVPFTYMPFGEGQHMCIGQRFGMLSAKIGLINFLKDFEVLPTKDTEIPLVMNPRGFTLSPKNGILLDIHRTEPI